MHTVLYDGFFEGWLCAVFDVYEYRLQDVCIEMEERFNGNIFQKIHRVNFDPQHSERVWKGLEKKLSSEALAAVHRTFLSEIPGIENELLRYVQHAFSSEKSMEADFGHPAVLAVTQTAKKVWREKHRMEAFVRFQKTGDGLFYALIEPDYNVLPLIAAHFAQRYADQPWMIYDGKRKYGLYYNLHSVEQVSIEFSETVASGKSIAPVYDAEESVYQQLWQRYFSSVNIAARKNTKLHIKHMPRRYWKYLVEKRKA
jgi:probable DNA metabolism protein